MSNWHMSSKREWLRLNDVFWRPHCAHVALDRARPRDDMTVEDCKRALKAARTFVQNELDYKQTGWVEFGPPPWPGSGNFAFVGLAQTLAEDARSKLAGQLEAVGLRILERRPLHVSWLSWEASACPPVSP